VAVSRAAITFASARRRSKPAGNPSGQDSLARHLSRREPACPRQRASRQFPCGVQPTPTSQKTSPAATVTRVRRPSHRIYHLVPCGDMPCLHDGEIGASLWEIVLAKSVAGKPCHALRFVPREGRNLARKLPYRDVCSAIGFCLKHTTHIALQAVGQTQSSRNGRMLKYATIHVLIFGHIRHATGLLLTSRLMVYLSWL
jgi:hypothetical protein